MPDTFDQPTATPEPAAPLPGQPFDPSRYLTQISGRDYLEVKWRLLWLRTLHPDAMIETEMVRDDGAAAVFRARVTVPGGGSATGWGSESYQDFADYIEKAETKSLGRALGALGYGTQFCQDFDFGAADHGRVVDAPVKIGRPRGTADPVTERQLKAVYAIGHGGHLTDAEIQQQAQETFGGPPEQLSRRDASALIDLLKQRFATQDDAANQSATAAKPTPPPPTARELSGQPAPKQPAAKAAAAAPPVDTDAIELLAARARLNASMQKFNVTGAQLLAEVRPVWPHLKTLPDLGLLTVPQLGLATGLVEDTHHVDASGKQPRIVAGPKPPAEDDGKLSLDDLAFEVTPAGT